MRPQHIYFVSKVKQNITKFIDVHMSFKKITCRIENYMLFNHKKISMSYKKTCMSFKLFQFNCISFNI